MSASPSAVHCAVAPNDSPGQCDDPDAKDRLNFAEGMEKPCAEGYVILCVFLRFVDRPPSVFLYDLAVSRLMEVSHLLEYSREKGVENGTGEDDGGNQVEVVLRNSSFFQFVPEGALALKRFVAGLLVGLKRKREMSVLVLLKLKLTAPVGWAPGASRRGSAQPGDEEDGKQDGGAEANHRSGGTLSFDPAGAMTIGRLACSEFGARLST